MEQNKKLTFVVFIHYRTWFRYTRRPHFSELSKFGKLFIIESPLIFFSKEFLGSPLTNIKNYLKYSLGFRKDTRNNVEIVRPILFFPGKLKEKFVLIKIIDLALLKIQLRFIKKNEGLRINFITSKSLKWLVSKNGKEFWILDINDDWSLMGYDKSKEEKIIAEVKNLISHLSMATAVTKKLTDKFNVDNKTIFIPNAVDTNHYVPNFENENIKLKEESVHNMFSDISFLKKEENDPRLYLTSLEPMKNMKKPVIGSYSGLSGNWSDFAFVARVEKLVPYEYSMVCSGNIHPPTVAEYIEEYKNYLTAQRMIYLGYVDYSVLPDFLAMLDVGLVMHRMDEFNTHSAPNKIWAYLAMGLPVVSTDFLTEPDKEIYEGLVSFADTPELYVQMIIEACKNDNLELRKKRRELAVRNSTLNRAEKLVNVMKKKLNLV